MNFDGLDQQPLPASGSAGLPDLPPTMASQKPVSFDGLGLNFDAPPPSQVPERPPQAAPMATPTAAPAGAQADDQLREERDFLANLPARDKIGLAMQSYGAAVNGGGDPIQAMLQRRRDAKQVIQKSLENNIKLVKDGMAAIEGLPAESPGRQAIIEMTARAAGPFGPQVSAALASAGTAEAEKIKSLVSTLDTQAARDMLVKASGGNPNTLVKLMSDQDFMARMEKTADQSVLPSALMKVRVLTETIKKMPNSPFIGADGEPAFTLTDLKEQNAKLPQQFKLSDSEMASLGRNQSAMIPYGLQTDKTLQATQEATMRAGLRDKKTPKTVTVDGKVYQFDPQKQGGTQRLKTDDRYALLGNAPSAAAAADQAGTGLSADAIKKTARDAVKDRMVLSNIGRGVQGAKDLRAVLNQMAEDEKATGVSTPDARAEFASNKKSLDKIVPQYDAITAFENSAISQGKILVDLARKADDTGMPVVERWIRAGRKSIAGDADVSEFNTQLHLFRTEAAKILTNPNLTGVLTDTARKDVESFLPDSATAKQIERVVGRLEGDFNIRKKTLEDQINGIKTRMSEGGVGGAQKPAAAKSTTSFASEAEASAAAKAGKIKAGDRITIGGQSGTWQ